MNLSQLLVASARCKALLGQGIIDIANGNYSAALPKIEEALQNNPNVPVCRTVSAEVI